MWPTIHSPPSLLPFRISPYAPSLSSAHYISVIILLYIALSRILESARASSTRPPSVPSAEKHLETVNALDATGLQLVKAINDAQSALASKEAELARLKEEARMLEESDPAAEAESDLDGTACVVSPFFLIVSV